MRIEKKILQGKSAFLSNNTENLTTSTKGKFCGIYKVFVVFESLIFLFTKCEGEFLFVNQPCLFLKLAFSAVEAVWDDKAQPVWPAAVQF